MRCFISIEQPSELLALFYKYFSRRNFFVKYCSPSYTTVQKRKLYLRFRYMTMNTAKGHFLIISGNYATRVGSLFNSLCSSLQDNSYLAPA